MQFRNKKGEFVEMFSYLQVFTSAGFFSRSGLLEAFIAQGTSNDSFFHLF